MSTDALLALAYLLLVTFIALPSLAALQQRRRSREGSEVAAAFAEYAQTVQRERCAVPLDESLLRRAQRLALPEMIAFDYLRQLSVVNVDVMSAAARRLALRLKRRVAFERKMLARTASGRRRGAVAAAAPAVVLLCLAASSVAPPLAALGWLLAFEGLGCWLLWRVARVEA